MEPYKPETGFRVTARQRQIIEHVSRYRLTTLEVLGSAVFPGMSRNALSKAAGRLCELKMLAKYPLLHPTNYFVLGQLGVHLLGAGEHRAAPLGPQSLPIEFAVLLYATGGQQARIRLTQVELLARCPWLPPSLAKAPHCLDQLSEVLELVRVDLGGPADYVARKCAADLASRRRIAEFLPFTAQQRFRLVVITATAEKSLALRQSLERHDWPTGLLMHLSIVPRLLTFIARKSHA